MSSCKKCDELKETPILFELLQDWFNKSAKWVRSTYHKKGHRIFDQ